MISYAYRYLCLVYLVYMLTMRKIWIESNLNTYFAVSVHCLELHQSQILELACHGNRYNTSCM